LRSPNPTASALVCSANFPRILTCQPRAAEYDDA
jgi:hypothetical protein